MLTRLGHPFAVALIGSLTCGGMPSEPELLDGRPVLFIGNSLTYTNDMPLIIRALAIADGQEPLARAGVTAPDFSLEDHWNSGDALAAIRRGSWEVVVMQQGPSSLPENQLHLQEAAAQANTQFAR